MTEKKVPKNRRRAKSTRWKLDPSRRDRLGFRGILLVLLAIQAYLQWGHPRLFPPDRSFDEQAARAFFTADSIRQAVAQRATTEESNGSRGRTYRADETGFEERQFLRNTQNSPVAALRISDSSALSAMNPAVLAESAQPKIELNTADSLDLVGVRGIGAYSAHVILKARRAFGGFYQVDQLADLYGIYPDNLELIRTQVWVDSTRVQKIAINTATYEELVSHPYVSSDLAAQIVRFRELFRPFENVRELGQLDLQNPLDFDKLAPYLITHTTADTVPYER